MQKKLLIAVLLASLLGIACIALVLLGGQMVNMNASTPVSTKYAFISGVLGLSLIAAGLFIRQRRRWAFSLLERLRCGPHS